MSNVVLVKHVMTADPKTINVDQPVALARKLMVEYNCRHLPVMDGNKLVGIISDRDISLAIELLKSTESDIMVRSVFVEDPYCVLPITPLHQVLNEMVKLHIGSAIVVESHKPIGIFTTMDACAALASYLQGSSLK